MNEKEWDKKWKPVLDSMPDNLETIEQVNTLFTATIERYEAKGMVADAMLWGNIQSEMNKIINREYVLRDDVEEGRI